MIIETLNLMDFDAVDHMLINNNWLRDLLEVVEDLSLPVTLGNLLNKPLPDDPFKHHFYVPLFL